MADQTSFIRMPEAAKPADAGGSFLQMPKGAAAAATPPAGEVGSGIRYPQGMPPASPASRRIKGIGKTVEYLD